MEDSTELSSLKKRLYDDILSADLQWSLLIAAMNSYRYDSVLRPFPPMYIKSNAHISNGSAHNGLNDENRDLNSLRSDAGSIAALINIDERKLSRRQTDLLHWALSSKTFNIRSCSSDKYSAIEALTGQSIRCATPDHIFEVIYAQAEEEKFDLARSGRSVLYAYHGSRVENFHSILHYGLNGHMSKNAVFGAGTYLSSELSVSLLYSPNGQAWDESALGPFLSLVAVCEIIDDPSVKCKVHDKSGEGASRPGPQNAEKRGRVAGSIGGDVPEKYYVVRNNEVLRVKYIFVYSASAKYKSSFAGRQNHVRNRRVLWMRWVRDNLFLVILSLYALLLVSLGILKSDSISLFLHRHGW